MAQITVTKTAARTAVTATAATLTTALDTTQPAGGAIYQVTSTVAAYVAHGIADTAFTAATDDTCTTVAAHNLNLGDAVQVSNAGGGLPAGLVAATTYFAIVSDALGALVFKLATTRANALAGTAIDLTTAGTGTQTVTTIATVGPGSALVAAGGSLLLDGALGPKVSIIRATADGEATVVQLAFTR